MALINNAIKNTGVTKTSDTSNNAATNIKANKKITNGLKTGSDSDSSSDNGDVATDDGATGADSTVNSKKQDAKTTVKNGTLTSDVDKSKDTTAPRGGPEGYAAHSPLGFNANSIANGYGPPGLPPGGALAGLSGLGSLFGGGMPSPPVGGGGGSPSMGSTGNTRQPQASKPEQKRQTRPEEKFGERPLEVDNSNKLSQAEMKDLAKYRESNHFTVEYNKATEPKGSKNMPKNFAENQAYACEKDPKLEELMQNFHQARNETQDKLSEKGGNVNDALNSREFLIGTGNPPVSGLKPLDDAYKAMNQHLEEKGYQYKDEDGKQRQMKADDLLADPKALENSTISESPKADPSNSAEQASFTPKLNLDMDILDSNELANLDYEDQDTNSDDFGFGFEDSLEEDLDLEIA